MHNHGTAVLDRPEAAPMCPVITGGCWFEAEDRPLTLRMELPLSAALMVAALYGENTMLGPRDLASDEDVWGQVATIVVQDGLNAIERAAQKLASQERRGTVTAPEWLAFCRRRVAEVTGGAA